MTTFVDSNVLIDLVSDNPAFYAWSDRRLNLAAEAGALAVDPIVFAEVSVRMPDLDSTISYFRRSRIAIVPTPEEALFLAGRAFLAYRRGGGTTTGVLPDFLVGAHAAHLGRPLLTRDATRYRTYFPTLALIAPDTHP